MHKNHSTHPIKKSATESLDIGAEACATHTYSIRVNLTVCGHCVHAIPAELNPEQATRSSLRGFLSSEGAVPRRRPTTTRRPNPHVQGPGSPTRTPKTPQGRRAGGGATCKLQCKVNHVAVQYGRNSRCSVEICVPLVAAASRRCCRPVWWYGLTPFARKKWSPMPSRRR